MAFEGFQAKISRLLGQRMERVSFPFILPSTDNGDRIIICPVGFIGTLLILFHYGIIMGAMKKIRTLKLTSIKVKVTHILGLIVNTKNDQNY